jgi:hypothetical protein
MLIMIFFMSSGCDRDRDLESATFNAYFYYSDNREVYLGQVSGISACRRAARAKAKSLNIENSHWSYNCCLKTWKSECGEQYK